MVRYILPGEKMNLTQFYCPRCAGFHLGRCEEEALWSPDHELYHRLLDRAMLPNRLPLVEAVRQAMVVTGAVGYAINGINPTVDLYYIRPTVRLRVGYSPYMKKTVYGLAICEEREIYTDLDLVSDMIFYALQMADQDVLLRR